MANIRDWSVAAKLLTAAAVCILLTFGLCSVGTPFEGHGTPAQDFAANAGLLSFLLAVVLVLAGIVAFLIGLVSGRKP